MRFEGIPIISLEGECDWETTLIRGALYYSGITSWISDDLNLVDSSENAICVVHSTHKREESIPRIMDRFNGTKIIAGRAVTLEYLEKKFPVGGNEILIYGEPYALIPQIVKDQGLLKRLKGKSVLGPLLNPAFYRSPPIAPGQKDWVYIMTSLGCQKRCGYCTYGATYSKIYSKAFIRRSRPWQDINNEIIDFMGKGIDKFVLLADQFLSKTPQDNQEILSLSLEWNPEKNGEPMLIFTISPLEILNNKALLNAMFRSFHLYPRYSIDSIDDNTLNLFNLDFNALDATEALKFLVHLKLPFRINYIFIRPGMTIESVENELKFFKFIDSITHYLDPYEKLLLAHDLFSMSLDLMQSTPLSDEKHVQTRYEKDIPEEILGIVSKIQNVMLLEINKIDIAYIKNENPLTTIIEAGLEEIDNLNSRRVGI